MDKILIKNLMIRGIIGINEWERNNPQDILINIIIYSDIQKAGESDNLEYSVNYKTIANKAINHAENAKRFTVEALAIDLANIILEEVNVLKVMVRVEKPGAVSFSESVGVEIERKKTQQK